MYIPLSTKNLDFLEKDSSEKRGDHHGGKGSRKRNAGYRGACLALERQLADSRSFVHAEFPPPFFSECYR
jgi:hypothetical protein|nr:MAG TPA: hypothetical protein [Caudoviricetes sp.]